MKENRSDWIAPLNRGVPKCPEDPVHARLIAFALRFEPIENIGIHLQRNSGFGRRGHQTATDTTAFKMFDIRFRVFIGQFDRAVFLGMKTVVISLGGDGRRGLLRAAWLCGRR